MEKTKETAATVMTEIVNKLSTIDGISTGDAIELGSLIQKYGASRVGEHMVGMLESLLKPAASPILDPSKPSWL